MQAGDLVAGLDYAHRAEPRKYGESLSRVRFTGPTRSGKAKVEQREGDLTGLVEWLPTRTLLCEWRERSAFLRDERRWLAIEDATDREWDPVVADAASLVLTATGEEGGFLRRWVLTQEKARRLWDRAHIADEPDLHPLAFVDRHGELHLPYEVTVRFAQAFAAAEPDAVALHLRSWEEQLEAQGWQPGGRSSHEFLRMSRPAHALARQWAGRGEIEVLRKEIERLRRLVDTAVVSLRRAGRDDEADGLRRGIAGS